MTYRRKGRENRIAALGAIFEHGPLSQYQIQKKAQLAAHSTAAQVVKDLEERGRIVVESSSMFRTGLKSNTYELTAAGLLELFKYAMEDMAAKETKTYEDPWFSFYSWIYSRGQSDLNITKGVRERLKKNPALFKDVLGSIDLAMKRTKSMLENLERVKEVLQGSRDH